MIVSPCQGVHVGSGSGFGDAHQVVVCKLGVVGGERKAGYNTFVKQLLVLGPKPAGNSTTNSLKVGAEKAICNRILQALS